MNECVVGVAILIAGGVAWMASGAQMGFAHDVNRVLARLDVDRPGLERVNAAVGEPELAARELLAYYRARTSFKHPVDRTQAKAVRGSYASQHDIMHADNALKHVLLASPSYPPHPFGETIDWSAQPVPDDEWRWQLHRMSFWNSMAKAYWHTGDERYVQEWGRQFVDWVAKNPHDAEHDYAWRSIEAGIRGRAWVEVYQHVIDSPSVTPAVLIAFLSSAAEHCDYLYDVLGKTERASNWRLMEAEGMAFLALAFPEFKDAEMWFARSVERLNMEARRQIRPDGMHFEQCLNYHTGCLRWLGRTAELARLNGRADAFPPQYDRTLERMCEAVMKLGLPNGETAQFGDDHSGIDVRRCLGEWGKRFERKDFLYVATAGAQGTPPSATAFSLADSGFYSMRSDWSADAICLVLKCGLDGGWHCQPDNGTFELCAGGRRLMPDSGTYIYGGDAAGRAWFRQTRVHQTLTLDGRDSEYAPSLRLFSPGDDLDVVVVENDSYAGLTHRRAVVFVKKAFFVIVDDAIGAAAGRVAVHFQLAPGDAVIDVDGLTARTGFASGANVLVQAMPQPAMTMARERGQVSFKYGHKESRPAFRYELAKETSTPAARFVTLVVPHRGAATDVRVHMADGCVAGGDRVELDVTVGAQRFAVGYDALRGTSWLKPAQP